MTKTIPKKKKCKKATWLSEEALQIADIDSQFPQISLSELLLLCPIGVRSSCFLVYLFSFVSKYFLFLIFKWLFSSILFNLHVFIFSEFFFLVVDL